ncbi:hypothetical protein MF672_038750 [Actinomadura sp. ATCC 31491]|uniref:Uncharacterized protein n=1 Tax=Actinomadura luzonensis TaxID=2805427 RepID=A0ABT0G510_9ACTN|nr:hypothetical protein [Actinomadura luzonensis]MCK2219694.1 hypothetical protein [Actinomadura luzonensis]
MRSYTSKSRKAESTPATFELDGVQFVGEGEISLMDISEFARLAAAGFDTDSADGIAILADIYRAILGPQEYGRFRQHCREHGTDGEVLIEILGGLLSEQGERPTERSSGSPDGPPTMPDTARVVSFSRATVTEVPVEEVAKTETEPQERRVVSYG